MDIRVLDIINDRLQDWINYSKKKYSETDINRCMSMVSVCTDIMMMIDKFKSEEYEKKISEQNDSDWVNGSVSAFDNGKIRVFSELLDGTFGLKFGDKVKIKIEKLVPCCKNCAHCQDFDEEFSMVRCNIESSDSNTHFDNHCCNEHKFKNKI